MGVVNTNDKIQLLWRIKHVPKSSKEVKAMALTLEHTIANVYSPECNLSHLCNVQLDTSDLYGTHFVSLCT